MMRRHLSESDVGVSMSPPKKEEKKADEIGLSEALSQISINYREIRRSPSQPFWCWWLIVFVTLSSFCLMQTYVQLDEYLNDNIKTLDSIQSRPYLPLPQVTFCTANWMDMNHFNPILLEFVKVNSSKDAYNEIKSALVIRKYLEYFFMDRFRFYSTGLEVILFQD